MFYNSGFKNCYVAKNNSDEILYIQWILFPHENEIISKRYKNRFLPLRENQVMLENAFTFPKFRGLQLYSQITIDLMELARKEGFRSCIVYCKSNNIIAMNELKDLGFKFTERIKERKLLGFTKRFFIK